MKIATNTSESFKLNRNYDFIPLGEDTYFEASVIILMLEKDWGSASIQKINALTRWVASYPKDIPCYIIGGEVTIPSKSLSDDTFFKYSDKKRDDAVRTLCNEVLRRSESIGVREEVTYRYLRDMLGYDEGLVDIIYTTDGKDNLKKIRSFIERNNPNLIAFEKDILIFQTNPKIVYERPEKYHKNIIISPPYITSQNQSVRLNADICIDGEVNTLWCETSSIYRQFLLVERADAFVCAILPFAMRSGKDIQCETPVSEQFLHNLNEILVPNLCAGDSRLYRSKIIAPTDSTSLIAGNAVATGMSCGVDSFYSTNFYLSSSYNSLTLTHLYCGNYLYGNEGPIFERAASAAYDLGLPLIQTATNISEFIRLPHLYIHFFKTMFGVLSLRKLFKTYFYSSAEDFVSFNLKNNSTSGTAGFELILLYTFSSPDFQVLSGGGGSTRLDKTKAISEFETAQKFLNVCLYPNNKKNCGKCGKCLRTLFMLDMIGALNSFNNVFDIDDYNKNRCEYFGYLIKQKNSKMLSSVYEYFLKNDANLMKEAEKLLLSSSN